MPQIEKPDDLQSIANLFRFFCVCVTIVRDDGNNSKQHVSVNLNEILDRLDERHCI